jgi:hypothetical protein
MRFVLDRPVRPLVTERLPGMLRASPYSDASKSVNHPIGLQKLISVCYSLAIDEEEA